MEQKGTDEIDLGYIFRKIAGLYNGFLVALFNAFQFVKRSWIILLVLIAVGIGLGYFLDKNKRYSKETTMIVQVNFNGSNYVYDAIEQLDYKIKEGDTASLRKLGLYKNGTKSIMQVTITPIVSVIDILKKAPNAGMNMDVLIEQSKYDDLLTSEIFIPEYQAHRLVVITSPDANQETLDNLLAYLNNNKILNEIKDATIENTKARIIDNDKSIAYLDSIFKVYGTMAPTGSSSNQVYVNSSGVDNENVHLMFSEKRSIRNESGRLQVELLKYDNIVETLNKPELRKRKSLLSCKKRALPIIFVFLFVLGTLMKNLYNKAKKLSESRELDAS